MSRSERIGKNGFSPAKRNRECPSNKMSSNTSNARKMSYTAFKNASPFDLTKTKIGETSFTYYGKQDATWEQMNAWLETEWGTREDGTRDLHWKWMGFGKAGQPDFQVVVVRRHCFDGCGCEDDSDSDSE